MHEFAQQLPALLGVVIGVITTYLLTTLGERARWRRTQRTRWDAARMQAYVDYGNAVKRVVHIASRMAVTRGFEHSSEPIPLDDGLAELNQASGDRTGRWESVLLLGDAETIAAARAWHQSVWQLDFFARGKLHGAAEWARAYEEYESARHEYYRHARKSLGVEGGDLPANLPPSWHARIGAEAGDAKDNAG